MVIVMAMVLLLLAARDALAEAGLRRSDQSHGEPWQRRSWILFAGRLFEAKAGEAAMPCHLTRHSAVWISYRELSGENAILASREIAKSRERYVSQYGYVIRDLAA